MEVKKSHYHIIYCISYMRVMYACIPTELGRPMNVKRIITRLYKGRGSIVEIFQSLECEYARVYLKHTHTHIYVMQFRGIFFNVFFFPRHE